MPITKTAQRVTLPQYLAEKFTMLGKKTEEYGKKVRGIKYPAGPGRAILRGLAKPITGLGKAIYNHPKVMVPSLVGLGLTGYYFNKNINKSMMHTDPAYNATHIGIFPNIKYNDPRRTQEYNDLNPLMI